MAMSLTTITALNQPRPSLSVPNEHDAAISHDAISLREMENPAVTRANQQSWINTWAAS